MLLCGTLNIPASMLLARLREAGVLTSLCIFGIAEASRGLWKENSVRRRQQPNKTLDRCVVDRGCWAGD